MNNSLSFKDVQKIVTRQGQRGDFYNFFYDIMKYFQLPEDGFPAPKCQVEEKNSKSSLEQPLESLSRITPFSKFSKKTRCNFDNINKYAIIIVNGNCGFVHDNKDNYIEILKPFNEYFTKQHIYILFVRGCSDNPRYFRDDIIDLGAIKTIPDYTVVNSEKANILCIGGGISFDRSWKITQNNTDERYFGQDEMPEYNAEALEAICNGSRIDTIVSYISPSFMTTEIISAANKWVDVDPELQNDAIKAYTCLDKIYAYLHTHQCLPNTWITTTASENVRRNSVDFQAIYGDEDILSIYSEYNLSDVPKDLFKYTISDVRAMTAPSHRIVPDEDQNAEFDLVPDVEFDAAPYQQYLHNIQGDIRLE